MTAKQAINQECRRCCGGVDNWRRICAAPDCAIHFRKKGLSVHKIKKFCLKCNPKQNLQGVKECDGKYPDGSICVLHPYRLGKNPYRKPVKVSEAFLKAGIAFRLKKGWGKKGVSSVPERLIGLRMMSDMG